MTVYQKGYLTLLYKKYNPYKIVFLLLILGLANIRWVSSTTNFYVAYHALPWFAAFSFILFIFIKEIYHVNKNGAKIFMLSIAVLFVGMLLYPKSYLWEKPNRQEIFTINYSKFYTNGMIINTLSNPDDTVFIDYWDSLIYWQADRDSSYQYAMYYPVTGAVPEYANKRVEMFAKNPPDFYYSDCGKADPKRLLPASTKSNYLQIYYAKKPACLLIDKQKASELTKKQLDDIKALNYTIPALVHK